MACWVVTYGRDRRGFFFRSEGWPFLPPITGNLPRNGSTLVIWL